MSKRKPSRPSSAKQKQRRAAQRREKATRTRVKGLYYPTGVAPDEFYKELGRLRKAAEAEIERLLVFIDALDDPDLEPDADYEPTLGSALLANGGDQEDWATPDVDEREIDPDPEPSLGWTSTGQHGTNDDSEDEHDGAEPDVEDEPTLGATEATDQEIGWRQPADFFGAGPEPEADALDVVGEDDEAFHDTSGVAVPSDLNQEPLKPHAREDHWIRRARGHKTADREASAGSRSPERDLRSTAAASAAAFVFGGHLMPLLSDREAKRAHVRRLREAAVALVRARGKPEGNIEYNGQLTRIVSFAEKRLHIEYWSPRYPTGVDRGERKPTTYSIAIKYDGYKVLALGWDGDRVNLTKYEAGGWERLLAEATVVLNV